MNPADDRASAILGKPVVGNPLHTGCKAEPPGRFTYLHDYGFWICQACGWQTGAALGGPQPTTPALPSKQAPATGSPQS